MQVICIAGKAGHGKDTVAGFLKDALEERGEKVKVIHFAWLLKQICREFFNWDGKKDERGRHLLQYVGTDQIRKTYPDYWVDFIIGLLNAFPNEWDTILIPDCRFPNEFEKFLEASIPVKLIKVHRPGCEGVLTEDQKKHVSETALDGYSPPVGTGYEIVNSGSLSDLEQICWSMADELVTSQFGGFVG